MPSTPSATPASPLFLHKAWFELLCRTGLPGAHRHVAVDAAGHRLHLLRQGNTLDSCANFYSPHFGFENGNFPSPEEARLLTRTLQRDGYEQLTLRPLRNDNQLCAILRTALEANHYRCDTLEVSTNWYLPCAGLSWPDYLAQRPSRLRNTLRRCQNKLAGTPGFRIDIIQHSGETLERAINDYNRVYASSWKEAEPFPHFIPELCRMTASSEWLRMGVLYVENEPAAAQIWFVKDQTASIYKLAYDARFAKLGVGTVLTAALFEQVMDIDKVSEIDFLTGDDAYKAEWMSHKRALVALLAFNTRSIGGLLRAARHFGPRWLKRKLGRT
jgi:Acetyltransferase (GNAT) domain